MNGIQILLLCGVFLSLLIYVRFFRSVVFDRVLAVFLFGLALIAILFPNLTTALANLVGVGRGADLLLYLLFLISIFLFLHLYAGLARLERRQTEIIRELALFNARKKE